MSLRLRLLLLVACLMAAVLGGSLAWLFTDLRAQFITELEDSLRRSMLSFSAGEKQRFRTLEVMAGSLEASPSFRNVLRQTDKATLLDFLETTTEGLQVDLVMVCDSQGKVLARSGKTSISQHPSAPGLTTWSGQTPALRHYWWLDGILYQGASVPLVDSQDYIEGYVSVAYRLDQAALQQIAGDLGSQLKLQGQKTTDAVETTDRFLWRRITLGSGPGQDPIAELLIGQSLAPMEGFVRTAGAKLLTLALVTFLLALAISYPLVGKIAHPIESLQRAQEDMAAIFQASLDGLVALDDTGRVSMSNPAAAVALGRESSSLEGQPLSALLPEGVMHELSTTPDGVRQQAQFERAGRIYTLHRTFVRPKDSLRLGSILLFHDVTEVGQRERQVSDFLQHLCHHLEVPDSPWSLRVGLSALQAWSRQESRLPSGESCHLSERLPTWAAEFRKILPEGRSCTLACDVDPKECAAISEDAARLLIEVLLDNALAHGQGEITVSLTKASGTLELRIRDHGPCPPKDLQSCLKDVGLGLKVANALCSQSEGRLEIGPHPESGTICLVVLPRGTSPC